MAYYNKYKGQGWYEEPNRHSLAAQGVKTGRFSDTMRKVGSGIGSAAKWTGSTLKEGFTLDDDDASAHAEYQDVVDGEDFSGIESEVNEPVDTGEIEEMPVEDHSLHHHEIGVRDDELSHDPEDKGLLSDMMDEPKSEAELLKHDVQQLEGEEEGFLESPRESMMDKVKDAVKAAAQWYYERDDENLSKEVATLESSKILLRDKIGMMNGLKQKVLASKKLGFGEKLDLVERVDKQLAPLVTDLNVVDGRVRESKAMLSKVERSNRQIDMSKRYSKDSEPSIFSIFTDSVKDAFSLETGSAKGAFSLEAKGKRVPVDFSNANSIKNAERQKARLENQGYNLRSTKQKGVDKFELDYSPYETNKKKVKARLENEKLENEYELDELRKRQ